jgi:hypothetical protein
LLFWSAPAGAVGDPDLEWWTLETAHFRIHHPHTLEAIAQRVARISEAVHPRLTDAMGYTPSSRTEIIITDNTDSANGSATSLPFNAVRLFVTAPDDMSPLGDYDDWILDLVTHEYTHILHTDNISGIPAVVNAVLGKSFSPNQLQPRWIIEGLAVLNETEYSSAGRLRGTLFDMYLRADVLEDNIARLDEISSVAHRFPQGTLWYLYGSRFLSWISSVYGPDTMRAVSADYGASLAPWGINRAIRRVTGRTYVELYEGFKDHLRRHYAETQAQIEKRGLREGTRLTDHGRQVAYPRFVPPVARSVPGREEIVYYRSDLNDREGIYRVALPARRARPAAPAVFDPVPRGSSELVARTIGASVATFAPSGDLVFNSTSIFKDVYPRDDLFRLPRGVTSPGGHESERRKLTTGLRATAPDVSPDGRRVVFVINNKGTTYLEIADLGGDGALTGRRELVPSARFEQAYTPRFSPDGRFVAYSAWTAGGYRDIRIVDVATGKFQRITHDRAVDMQPVWSSDQKTLYFVSDRTGISNIYAYDIERASLLQVTNVRIGAFQPAPSADGKTLVYVGYSSQGFDLHAMDLDRRRFLEALPAPTDRPDLQPEPTPVASKRYRYNPLPTLAPRSYSIDFKPGTYGPNAITVTTTGADVVGHHALAASLVIDFDAPSPQFVFDYVYGRLPVDLSARFFHTVAPRNGYRINDIQEPYDEYANGITAGLSRYIVDDFSVHSVGLSYSVTALDGDLPVGDKLDPYATRTVKPREGVVSSVHLGYGLNNVEGSIDASGPARGIALSLGLDYADEALVSDYSLRAFEYSLTGYIPMPWPGHHTLAVRSSGGIASGTYGRGGVYSVGGYDLEQNTILDTVTTGIFNAAFVLRGYPPRAYIGREYLLETAEYRFPIAIIDRGVSTLPVYLRRFDGNLFVDYGGAFDDLDLDAIELFHDGYLIDSPQLHASVGGEIWINMTLGYYLNTQFRLGYAYGFSEAAVSGGQLYFVASSAF